MRSFDLAEVLWRRIEGVWGGHLRPTSGNVLEHHGNRDHLEDGWYEVPE
jgi:hypothetical protein